MKHFYIIISALLLFSACHTEVKPTISVKSKTDTVDSLFITNIITNELIYEFPVTENLNIETTNDSIFLASIHTRGNSISYLTIVHPEKNIEVTIQSDSTLITNSVGDSLVNYLWLSNVQFASNNISTHTDSILNKFDSFRLTRAQKINAFNSELLPEEHELLLYQNDAIIYSFLFILGRSFRGLPPNHNYFQFANQLDNNSKWAKTLPNNLLYKHEINFVRKNDSLTSLSDFTDYIEEQTTNKDLSEFLKYSYINNIIESPSYWEKHQKLFNSKILKKEIKKEKENAYYELLNASSHRFFEVQKGSKAFNFTAKNKGGELIKLSNFKGKLVYIDNWASWCGPCIGERPNVLQLVEKYKNHPKVEILMVSVDAQKQEWLNILKERNELHYNNDVLIQNGMRTRYGDEYRIKFIPKYILIGADGLIINSDIGPPSIAVEQIIDKELEKLY
ncbi:TlpA family protein disulfide reductase [Winogradskyella immobilis]|uniref:TlpA family protein disulfide reductase n=1 Tax=Winogradskyella immobilis TaxID=2816852 RepID=A0ABS8EK79_9FLAO|nr:TlpA disulfide reductase family protein [Winogradskyella immobilis]MCC1483599.1 TlpA family protein disulfide reductase [Winogradskyella immobilis]MCG0015693.1 TlpA family protein disulfide reductase [Winogradskyella immobilis]